MAVHTVLSSTEIKRILSSYEIGGFKKYNGIKEGIENTNYLVVTSKNKFILTIYEERTKDELIPFYMDVMYNSSINGIKCPTPIKDKIKSASGYNPSALNIIAQSNTTEPTHLTYHERSCLGVALLNILLLFCISCFEYFI